MTGGGRSGPDVDVEEIAGLAESARPVEGRRARVLPDNKSKKKKERGKHSEGFDEGKKRDRGGGNSWQNWDDWEEDKE